MRLINNSLSELISFAKSCDIKLKNISSTNLEVLLENLSQLINLLCCSKWRSQQKLSKSISKELIISINTDSRLVIFGISDEYNMLNLLKDRNMDSSLANNIKLSSKSKLSMYKVNFNTKKHTIHSSQPVSWRYIKT